MIPIVILAGGLATRMRPATEVLPKSLLSVAGGPFIDHQLKLLRREGFDSVVLCVGYRGEMIEKHVGDGRAYGLDVRYRYDGEKLLGTGGAIRRALDLAGDAFFVLYGDSYLDIEHAPVLDAFRRAGKSALMTVFHNGGKWDTSNVRFDGTTVYYNKKQPAPDMTYIDYGLSILTSEVLAPYPNDEAFDLADVFLRLSERQQLAGFEVKQRFYEIGTPDGLRQTAEYLEGRR